MFKNNWPYTNAVDPEIYKGRTDWPKISIVTPSYNQGQYIEETILSILNQNYPNLEYIIIDGGSTDHTVEIIKKYEDRITYWVSEKDNGQSHAINKGFEKATGEIFAYLNSDDCYYPNTFWEIANTYVRKPYTKTLWIGDCNWAERFDDVNGSLDKPNFPNSLYQALLQRGLAPQPSMFWTNPLKLKFNEDLKFCMDFDFWLKLILKKYEIVRTPKTLSLFRIHKDSKTSTLNQIQEEELNGLTSLYKKFLSDENNLTISNLLIKQNQYEYYSKLTKNRRLNAAYLKMVMQSNLSLKLKLKALLQT
ncbi:glycosyltransferase family 2 protein [Pedobacter sp. UBA4863]|uniref:glycosyltransferase family 2 protein n=1 Tax=Pedobacter sp. UBA4863 TaxID=1947060 RepID=UPI0025CE1890|nr:glycosyltransferase family 2 protein [Pedobacter sp. UBA4863]